MSTEFRDQIAMALAVHHANEINKILAKGPAHELAVVPPEEPDPSIWTAEADIAVQHCADELHRLAEIIRTEPMASSGSQTRVMIAELLEGRADYLASRKDAEQ
jgi:hypothetical protein